MQPITPGRMPKPPPSAQLGTRPGAACAHKQNARRFEPFLSLHSHLRHNEMPAIAGHFLGRQVQMLGSSCKGISGNWHDREIQGWWKSLLATDGILQTNLTSGEENA